MALLANLADWSIMLRKVDLYRVGEGAMRMKGSAKSYSLSALLAAALLMGGCASQQYMGVSLKPGGADPAVQALAARASIGDKQAQLVLGIRFLNGQGMTADERRACNLFRLSASDSGGPLWIYTPSPGGGAPARVLPVQTAPPTAGLASARVWLERCAS
jgi:TPR repeat protein